MRRAGQRLLQIQVLRLQLVSEFQSRGSLRIFSVLLRLTLNFQSKMYIVVLENVTKIDRVSHKIIQSQ